MLDPLAPHARATTRSGCPGIDHAGIATQVVVERQLAARGQDAATSSAARSSSSACGSGRRESGGRIAQQQRVLGASRRLDARAKFTMDPDLSRAVREAFVRLYEEGLIYRATRLINW